MKRGFTLIELLVVISIISLLSSIVFSSLQDTRARARDAQRLSDISSLRIALEYAKSDGDFEPYYYLSEGGPRYSAAVSRLVSPGYIPSIPQDPAGRTGTQGYWFLNLDYDYVFQEPDSDFTNTYTIRFYLEEPSNLGAPGYYCATTLGIHRAGEHPESSTSNKCVQE
tara:strand:- start:1004 stop:1507 length:504 start_codon:yes stop_codon:yes gene_type:complete